MIFGKRNRCQHTTSGLAQAGVSHPESLAVKGKIVPLQSVWSAPAFAKPPDVRSKRKSAVEITKYKTECHTENVALNKDIRYEK